MEVALKKTNKKQPPPKKTAFVYFITWLLSLLPCYFLRAQEKALVINTNGYIGIGTVNPKAALDLSSAKNGVLFPRLSTKEIKKIPNPVAGMMLYDNSINKLICYSGQRWQYADGKIMKYAIGDTIGQTGTVLFVDTSGEHGLLIKNGGFVTFFTSDKKVEKDYIVGANGANVSISFPKLSGREGGEMIVQTSFKVKPFRRSLRQVWPIVYYPLLSEGWYIPSDTEIIQIIKNHQGQLSKSIGKDLTTTDLAFWTSSSGTNYQYFVYSAKAEQKQILLNNGNVFWRGWLILLKKF